MTLVDKINKGDAAYYKGEYFLVWDWCRNCRKVWLDKFGKRKVANYKDVKLVKK
jgi:hypothetical protein